MKKHYPWLWFDADGTLFDFNKAESTALFKAFQVLNLHYEDRYLDSYQAINLSLWQALERREVTSDVLRLRRFEMLLEAIDAAGSAEQLRTAYEEQLSLCTDLIDGTLEVLQTLHKTSKIAIITNGLQAIQRSRVHHSLFKHHIAELIISDEIGAAKPHSAFFDIALAQTGNPPKSDILVIGDSLTSDMQGGANYGLDTCWFNPAADPRPTGLTITYEIRTLDELLNIIN